MNTEDLFLLPGSDEIFLNIKEKNSGWQLEAKKYWNALYQKYKNFLDRDFLQKIPNEFISRLWELTMIDYLHQQNNRGINLLALSGKGSKPDFCFELQNQKFYVEAVCSSPGKHPNLNIPLENLIGEARRVPIDEHKETLASTIHYKAVTKYHGENNSPGYKYYIGETAGYIIAVSTAKISSVHNPNNINNDLSCLFPISEMKIPIYLNQSHEHHPGAPYHDYQPEFYNHNGSPININYFACNKFNHISALLISRSWYSLYPDLDQYEEMFCNWGKCRNDFVLIHNPYAKIPLSQNILPVSKLVTAKIDNDSIKINIQ